MLFAVGSTMTFDTEHPKFASVHYRAAADGSTVWQTVDPVNDYTRSFVRQRWRSLVLTSYFPQLGTRQTFVGGAPSANVPGPRLRVLADTVVGDHRTVRLRSRRDAAVMSLLVHTVVGSLTATVEGQRLGAHDTTLLDGTTVRWAGDYYAPPREGIDAVLRFAAGPPVLLRAVDLTYGLPAGLAGRYPARPAGMLTGRLGDCTLAETTLRLPSAGRPAAAD